MHVTHASPDSRFVVGYEGQAVYLYDGANPQQPVRSWPATEHGYGEALAYGSQLAGTRLSVVPNAPEPPYATTRYRQTSGWWITSFVLAVIIGVVGLIAYVGESSNTQICNSTLGILGRAGSSSANQTCQTDIALHNGGGIVAIICVVIVVLMIGVRISRR